MYHILQTLFADSVQVVNSLHSGNFSACLVLVELVDDVSGVNVGGDEGHDDLPLKLAQVASDAHDELRQLDDVKVKPPAKGSEREWVYKE